MDIFLSEECQNSSFINALSANHWQLMLDCCKLLIVYNFVTWLVASWGALNMKTYEEQLEVVSVFSNYTFEKKKYDQLLKIKTVPWQIRISDYNFYLFFREKGQRGKQKAHDWHHKSQVQFILCSNDTWLLKTPDLQDCWGEAKSGRFQCVAAGEGDPG